MLCHSSPLHSTLATTNLSELTAFSSCPVSAFTYSNRKRKRGKKCTNKLDFKTTRSSQGLAGKGRMWPAGQSVGALSAQGGRLGVCSVPTMLWVYSCDWQCMSCLCLYTDTSRLAKLFWWDPSGIFLFLVEKECLLKWHSCVQCLIPTISFLLALK